MIPDPFDLDPQDSSDCLLVLPDSLDLDEPCPACFALADICPYHRGWADGWDSAASLVRRHAHASAEQGES